MNDNREFEIDLKRHQYFSDLRKEIISLPQERALDKILEFKHPPALVHSFPDEDLFFLIHDIGIEDAIPIIALASTKQLVYLLDVEIWEKDMINMSVLTKWFDAFLQADPKRFTKWFIEEKLELMEYYMFKNLEVKIREHDQDPSDFDDDFFTLDDIFYVRFSNYQFDPEPNEDIKEIKENFLTELIRRIADFDHVKYQKILMEAASVLPSEFEEEEFRMRNVRLSEKGFVPYYEAISIYAPLYDLGDQGIKKYSVQFDKREIFPVPLYSLMFFYEENLFNSSLKQIELDDIRDKIYIEFAGLCNTIISADQKLIREKEELKEVVKKALGYLNIGLQLLSLDQTNHNLNYTASIIRRYPLSEIFRIGYSSAQKLKEKTIKWLNTSWFRSLNLPLMFWGETGLGVLGGLLLKRPLYYDNYKSGVIYREFASMEDISITDDVLEDFISLDEIMALFNITSIPKYEFITYKNIILTLWARNFLKLSDEILAMNINDLKIFLENLFVNSDDKRVIPSSMKESFLEWIAKKTGVDSYAISIQFHDIFTSLFKELEDEYGDVRLKNLDPKFIYLFLVQED
ncbi:MAG: hypothetical protein HQK76_05470 [Desulfobacterales bacterium]|nr:hypothetical protein [Desulfobacterales bacterium]